MSRISGLAASRTLSQLLAVIVTVVVITTLYLAKTVILPLALALLLSFVLAPLVTGLERLRIPRIVGIPIVILVAGAVLGVVGWTVLVQLVEVTDALPAYTTNIHDKLEALHRTKTTSFTRAQQELDVLSKQLDDLRSEFAGDGLIGEKKLGSSPARPISVREVGGSQGRLDAISGLLGLVISVVLVAVFTFFMLLKREDLRNRLIQLSGHGHLYIMTRRPVVPRAGADRRDEPPAVRPRRRPRGRDEHAREHQERQGAEEQLHRGHRARSGRCSGWSARCTA